ncbi:MAG TPA: OmpA family protein [Rhizomicrobium sp.]|nr:OmpA family protein [Rhizomicrobium sp.]
MTPSSSKSIAPMHAAKYAVPLLALAVSACGGGPRPIYEPPPSLERRASETPHPAPRPSTPGHVTIPPSTVGAAPLTVARVGDYMDALESDLRHHVHARGIVTARQGDDITVVIENQLLFTSDGGVAGDDVLEPLGAVLRNYPHTSVAVGGFTDTTGTPEQNLALSQKHARLIADALAHEGVAPQRISAQGFGQTHLRVATGDNRKEPRNRRIEIVLKAHPG